MTEQTFSKGDRVRITTLGGAKATVAGERHDTVRDETWWFVKFDRPSVFLDTCYYAHELERIEEVAA